MRFFHDPSPNGRLKVREWETGNDCLEHEIAIRYKTAQLLSGCLDDDQAWIGNRLPKERTEGRVDLQS